MGGGGGGGLGGIGGRGFERFVGESDVRERGKRKRKKGLLKSTARVI